MDYTIFTSKFAHLYKNISDEDFADVDRRLKAMHTMPEFSVSDLNQNLRKIYSEQGKEFKDMKELSPEERRQRYELSKRAHDGMVSRFTGHRKGIQKVDSTLRRYPEDLLYMHDYSEEAQNYNKHILEIFDFIDKNVMPGNENMSEEEKRQKAEMYKEEFLDLHIQMYSKVYEHEKFFSKSHTDEELVDNINMVLDSGSLGVQTQNVGDRLKQIPFDTPAQKEKLEKLKELIAHYKTIELSASISHQRIGAIADPMYSEFDISDANTYPFFLDASDIKGSKFTDPIDKRFKTDIYSLDTNPAPLLVNYPVQVAPFVYNQAFLTELNSMKELLSYDGSAVSIRVEGSDKEVKKTSVEVYEILHHPDRKIIVTNTKTGESLETKITDMPKLRFTSMLTFARSKAFTLAASEDLPAPVEEPKTPVPEKPGIFARIMHAVSFGLFYRKTFDDYNRQLATHNAEQKAYDDYRHEKETVELAHKLQEICSRKVNPELYTEKDAKAAVPTPFDEYINEALAKVNSADTAEKDLQYAAATLYASHLFITASKTSPSDVPAFKDSVDNLLKVPDFVKALGSVKDIRENFSNQKNAALKSRNISSQLSELNARQHGSNTVQTKQTEIAKPEEIKEINASVRNMN